MISNARTCTGQPHACNRTNTWNTWCKSENSLPPDHSSKYDTHFAQWTKHRAWTGYRKPGSIQKHPLGGATLVLTVAATLTLQQRLNQEKVGRRRNWHRKCSACARAVAPRGGAGRGRWLRGRGARAAYFCHGHWSDRRQSPSPWWETGRLLAPDAAVSALISAEWFY